MIGELIRALKAGEELKNAESWKNLQATTGAVTAIAGAAVMALRWVGVDIPITDEQLVALGGGVAAVLGVFNSYTTLATSKRVGLPAGNQGNAAPRLDATPEQHIDP